AERADPGYEQEYQEPYDDGREGVERLDQVDEALLSGERPEVDGGAERNGEQRGDDRCGERYDDASCGDGHHVGIKRDDEPDRLQESFDDLVHALYLTLRGRKKG